MKKTVLPLLLIAFVSSIRWSFGQVKIGTNPTTIDVNNNLEVEASTPGRKVSITKSTGKVTIADGSQGTDKILTSDGNGVATWNDHLPKITFHGELSAVQTIPFFGTPANHDALDQRLNLTPFVDLQNNWIAGQRKYYIPESGLYTIHAGLSCIGNTIADLVLYTRIWIDWDGAGPLPGTGPIFKGAQLISQSSGDWQSVTFSDRLAMGASISLDGYTMRQNGTAANGDPSWTANCGPAYLTVTKVGN